VHPEMREIQSALASTGRRRPPADLRERILRACDEAEPVEEISCEECLELVSAYLDDELHRAERDCLEAHLFSCEACYVAFRRMQRTADVLRETPAARAPEGLHGRITAAVADQRGAESVFAWRRAAKVLGGLAAAAALIAAVLIPRGGEMPGVEEPAIAELPPETTVGSMIDAEPADGPLTAEAVGEESAEAVEPAGVDEPASPERPAGVADVRQSRPRGSVVAETPSPAGPARSAASSGEAQPESSATVRPRTERDTAPASAAETVEPRRPARTTPEPAPVVVEERSRPAPEHETAPQIAPEPPARQPAPRETAVAALPRDPAPQPVTSSEPSAEPVSAGVRPSAPKPGSVREPIRATVVPRQAPPRAVYQPEPTPPAERSEQLARMAAGINGSQTPRMDNPPSGIQLN
jgi:hypothetical protein